MTLIKPVITEKSMLSARRGIYTFMVLLAAGKNQVKEAVETAFKVKVIAINILRRHVPGKSTGSKRLKGSPSQTKFASVKLVKGQSIDLFDQKDSK
ncbi:MAG: 50S ribosomal protein L23 [bacterium]